MKLLLIFSFIIYLLISYIGSVAKRNYEEGYKNGMIEEHQRSTPNIDPNKRYSV